MKFVQQLTDKEILKLIPFYQVYDFEECESSNPETRRFRIQPTYDGPAVEVLLADSYEDGNIRLYGVKEEAFIRFMAKKFGVQYALWYETDERQKTSRKILEFADRYNRDCNRKIKLCFGAVPVKKK